MTQKEVVEKCKEKNLNYSYMQIYRIGLKQGFIEKHKPRNIFHEDKFNEWLNTKGIPEDCMTIADAMKKYGLAYQIFKYHFEKEGIEVLKGGLENGGLKYAKKSDIERIVEKHNNSIYKRRNKNNG